MERVRFTNFKRRVSWGSIFGGVVTVLAISMLFSILGSSIGLFMFDPQSEHPTSGIGATVGIWTVIALIISLGAGGFVAGKLAGRDGLIHGFLVWATTMIATVILGVFLAVGAVKMTANVLGSVSSVVGNVISGVGSAVGSGVSGLADKAGDLMGNIDFTDDMDRKEVRQDIRQALRKSGVKEFQPEYLQRQLKGVKGDLNRSAKRLATNPNDADKVINDFLNRLSDRTEKAFQNVDRNDISKAIANNTNLSKAEADKAVDEYTEMINNAREEGREKIAELQQSIEQAKQDWEEFKQNARIEAEKATNAAAWSAIWSFFALLIGAVLCAFAGSFGTRKTQEGYEA